MKMTQGEILRGLARVVFGRDLDNKGPRYTSTSGEEEILEGVLIDARGGLLYGDMLGVPAYSVYVCRVKDRRGNERTCEVSFPSAVPFYKVGMRKGQSVVIRNNRERLGIEIRGKRLIGKDKLIFSQEETYEEMEGSIFSPRGRCFIGLRFLEKNDF